MAIKSIALCSCLLDGYSKWSPFSPYMQVANANALTTSAKYLMNAVVQTVKAVYIASTAVSL